MGMNMKTNVSINDEFEDNMVDYVEESDDPMLKDLDEDEYFNGASDFDDEIEYGMHDVDVTDRRMLDVVVEDPIMIDSINDI